MKNTEISAIFRQIANILEIKGDNPFRIRAYERAAQNIEGLTENIENLISHNRLSEVPGIGKDLSERIKEYCKTGKIRIYEQIKKTIPEGLLELLNIPSVGPKTVKLLYDELNIKNLRTLESAIKKGELKNIFGIKEKTIENMINGIELIKRKKERMTLAQATCVADEFINALRAHPEVKKISCAGSLRRKKETVRDIDILVVSASPEKIMNAFTKTPFVKDILAKGETKSSIRTKEDTQVDCRAVDEKSYGAALLYFTGSKNFNIKIRGIAQRRGYKINEYGAFTVAKEKLVAGKTEEEIFKLLKMPYIVPELREDAGEIESALKFKLPKLLELNDIKSDLHVHSRWSDGNNSIEEIALSAKQRGYSYIAITDHSQSLRVARGMSVADLKKKKKEIEAVNKKINNFMVLFGTEVDIDSEGNIDYKDSVLKEFDLVIAAIHTGFKQTKEKLTKRLIKACQNKYVHIIAHPTGRLLGARAPYDIDMDEVLRIAKLTNTYLEINAFPDRLDLNDVNSRKAKEFGVRLALGTDSHEINQLEAMKFGVATARRGWLSKEDVINTLPVEEMLKVIRK